MSEAVDFYTRSSDEDTDNDETFSDQEDSAANQNQPVSGGLIKMLSESENDDLTSGNERARLMKWKRHKTQIDNFTEERTNILFVVLIRHSTKMIMIWIEIANVEQKEIDVPLEENGKQVKTKITWTTKKPTQNICQGPQNIVRNRTGVKPEYRGKVEPLDAWSRFIDDDIIQFIVTYANQSINESIRRLKQNKKDQKVCHLIETNHREIRAFIGLWYIRGLLNWTFHDIATAYSREYGHKIFNATMSMKRFRFLCANIRFDDITSRTEHFQHDRAAAVRLFFESFVTNCEKVMIPDAYLFINETLYPTRVIVAFLQYNKNKSAKYGLLFRSINSAEMPYTNSSPLYTGKPPGESNEHYLTSTDDIIRHLVSNLSDHVNLQCRNISCDRFYSSIDIANWLLEKKMTVVGTIKTNPKGVGDLKKMDGSESQTTADY